MIFCKFLYVSANILTAILFAYIVLYDDFSVVRLLWLFIMFGFGGILFSTFLYFYVLIGNFISDWKLSEYIDDSSALLVVLNIAIVSIMLLNGIHGKDFIIFLLAANLSAMCHININT